MSDLSKPVTKDEVFLAVASGDLPKSTELPEPQTRVQEYLKKIAQNGGSGGSSIDDEHISTSTTYSSAKIEGIAEKKAENVHLYCDGSAIYYFDDKTTPLSFAEVKAIIENDVHSVFLSNNYYSFYGKYYFRPEITSQDKEAIGFIGETQLDGECYSWRVIINEDGDVKEDEIWLAKHSDVAVVSADVEYKNMIHVDGLGIKTSSEKNRVEFKISYTVPENYTIDRYGVLYQSTAPDGGGILLSINSTPDDADGVYIKKAEKTVSSSDKQISYRAAIAVNEFGSYCTLMPYMYFKDEHAKTHLIHGDCIRTSYSEVKSALDNALKETDTIKEIYELIRKLTPAAQGEE